jgi:L-lysine 2,3-aminomutase
VDGSGSSPVEGVPATFRTFGRRNLDAVPGIERLSADHRFEMEVVAAVLPFKTNSYVCEQLIDWDRVPDDPIFQLTFPQREMLNPDDFDSVADLLGSGADKAEVDEAAARIQRRLNPHPSGQTANTPHLEGRPVAGMQHKYDETVLFFPAQGQTCHAYCTYCFRWPQFVNLDDLRFASKEIDGLTGYLRAHPEVTDVIFTGGDPMIMRTAVFERYVDALLAPEFEHVDVRIGSKAPAYWPHRFVDDKDADDLMRLFERVVGAGRHLAFMAHYSHPHELRTDVAREAVRRITDTGAVVRGQAPLIGHVNDSAEAWAELVRTEVRLGAVPYYQFVERDTGAKRYFEVPLVTAYEIYTEAYRRVSGLARTFRGPVMSADPGKVLVDGITEVNGERVFVLKFLQARRSEWVNRVFFARYDPKVAWFDEMKPAFGQTEFFFERDGVEPSEGFVDLQG